MTDNEKMREEFEKWYMRIHPHIHYMVRTQTDGYANRHAQELWEIWQAAKSVPVVGEPVAWAEPRDIDTLQSGVFKGRQTLGFYLSAFKDQQYSTPLLVQPTTSITEAELERLRKCEALLKEAYGYTTAASDLLPERIKAAIAGEKK